MEIALTTDPLDSSRLPKMRELPITLPSSLSVAVVRLPEKMPQSDFDVLKKTIEGWETALVQKAAE